MLEFLHQRATEGSVALDRVQAGFLSYEHIGPPADALHQLPDFGKAIALDRIAAMMRPGGVLRLHDLIYDVLPSQADQIFQRWLDNPSDDPATGYTCEDFAEHIRTEYSTFRWLLETMLAMAGFDIVTAEFHSPVYGAYTCFKR